MAGTKKASAKPIAPDFASTATEPGGIVRRVFPTVRKIHESNMQG